MTDKRLTAAAGLLAATLATGCSAIASDTDNTNADPVRCEIQADDQRGMVRLQGVMHADTDVNGTYTFTVKSVGRGGSTNISQGSSFYAGPSGPTTLGMVMLSAGGAYDVELDVKADGQRYRCAERIGGVI
ncbi:MAG: hypothetical protein ED558_12645 [Oricola sp.]|nr:MAG: hypothetical protein ED558_12645 [Oricola sp.]